MTTDNMLFGAGELDKAKFEEALEFVGAEFSTGAALDYSLISSSFAKKDQEQILKLFADVILSPKFNEEEFSKYQTRYLGSLKRQKESPRRVAGSGSSAFLDTRRRTPPASSPPPPATFRGPKRDPRPPR